MTGAKRGRAALAALPDPDADVADAEAVTVAPVAPPPSDFNDAFVNPDEQPVPVPFRSCTCPDRRHGDWDPQTGEGGDVVYLRPSLDLEGGFTFTSSFSENTLAVSDMPPAQALGMAYLVAGIAAWTFVDKKGRPIPASRPNIARLRWTPAIAEIADVAARRYGASALLPLLDRMQRLSRDTPTDGSTSPRRRSSGRRRGRS